MASEALVIAGPSLSRLDRRPIALTSDPWENAKAAFLEGLSDAQQSSFLQAVPMSPEDLLYEAGGTHQRFEDKSTFRKLQRKIKPLVDALDDYGKALDVFSNIAPTFISPIWGSVRVVLALLQKSDRYFVHLLDMFGQIGKILLQLRQYEALFPQDQELTRCLTSAYLDILIFCTSVKNSLLASKKPGRVTMKQVWKSISDDFDDSLERLRSHAKMVGEQAQITHMALAKAHRDQLKLQQDLEDRQRLLDRLCVFDPLSSHLMIKRARHPQTCQWHLASPLLQDWIASSSQSFFVLYGIPGSGKSVLASSVIDMLLERADDLTLPQPSAVAFHYCDYSEKLSLRADTIYRSLCRQLLHKLTISDKVKSYIRSGLIDSRLLADLAGLLQSTFLVIDGVDELDIHAQNELITSLKQIVAADGNIKIYLTSRSEESRVRRHLRDEIYLDLATTLTDMSHDLDIFIRSRINELIALEELEAEDLELQTEIIHTLSVKAEDMFLWVALQLKELCGASNPDEVRKMLSLLPRDLEQTYVRMLQKITESSAGQVKLQKAVKAFSWLLHAQRPLTLVELNTAISIRPSDKQMMFKRVPADTDESVLDACGNFVVLDRETGTVHLIHHTAYSFLQSIATMSSPELHLGMIERSLLEQLEDSATTVARICVNYLHFPDSDKQLSLPSARPTVDTRLFGVNTVVQTTFSTVSWVSSLACHLISILSQAQPKLLNAKAVELAFPAATSLQSENIQRKYVLLDYVAKFWVFHCAAAIDKQVSSQNLSDKVQDLLFTKQCSFPFRPWAHNPDLSLSVRSMMEWGIEKDNNSIFLLLEKAPGVNFQFIAEDYFSFAGYEKFDPREYRKYLRDLRTAPKFEFLSEHPYLRIVRLRSFSVFKTVLRMFDRSWQRTQLGRRGGTMGGARFGPNPLQKAGSSVMGMCIFLIASSEPRLLDDLDDIADLYDLEMLKEALLSAIRMGDAPATWTILRLLAECCYVDDDLRGDFGFLTPLKLPFYEEAIKSCRRPSEDSDTCILLLKIALVHGMGSLVSMLIHTPCSKAALLVGFRGTNPDGFRLEYLPRLHAYLQSSKDMLHNAHLRDIVWTISGEQLPNFEQCLVGVAASIYQMGRNLVFDVFLNEIYGRAAVQILLNMDRGREDLIPFIPSSLWKKSSKSVRLYTILAECCTESVLWPSVYCEDDLHEHVKGVDHLLLRFLVQEFEYIDVGESAREMRAYKHCLEVYFARHVKWFGSLSAQQAEDNVETDESLLQLARRCHNGIAERIILGSID